MDHDIYDSWEKVSNINMSDNGNIIVFQVEPQEGDGLLIIRNSTPDKRKPRVREIALPRGYAASLAPEGDWLYCRIKPEFAKSRQEKIKKVKKEERSKDTLAIVNLKEMTVKKLPGVESYTSGLDAKPYVAYKSIWKEKPVKSKTKSGLIVFNPANEKADTLLNVDKYVFSRDGKKLVFTTKKDKKDSLSINAVMLRNYMQTAVYDTLAKGHRAYGCPVFSDDCREIAFTATNDTNKTGNKRFALFLTKIAISKVPSGLPETKEIVSQGEVIEGTDGWTLNENSEPFFSKSGNRIFIGIAPIRPPKDTTIVDFETAELDIWNWDSPYTPPQQKKRLDATLKKTYMSVIDIERGTAPVVLTTSVYDDISIFNGGDGDWALSSNDGKYILQSAWDYNSYTDLALVSLKDGGRLPIADKLNAFVRISPSGKYLIWYDMDDYNFYTYNIATGKIANITASAGTKFYDEENDRPMYPIPYDNKPIWLENDSAVLIADRYDIWKLYPDGTRAENLTKGVGRSEHLHFRTIMPVLERFSINEKKSGIRSSIKGKDRLYLSVFNEDDMRNGIGYVNVSNPKSLKYIIDTVSFRNLIKAPDSDRIAFLKGNFRNPYDLYVTKDNFKSDEKLSGINPQIKNYRWGRAELFHWKAYDGTPLKGLVFVPDGVKPGDKLPVMVYFYEKYSETLYDFRTPAPSRSIVNIPLYTSRGYICFIPDIVYKVGHPGESAYNCIVSGAEALCEKYSFADKDRMAIQGQSWGGYQTAYLVTKTNLFAAAGAGAPVGNMTSAYGGIRWESGIVRAGQYEHGQSRIGKTLWDKDGFDLYVENSPVFHLNKVKTPLLIMHNDADGAVPWYQGIEIFSNMRRLGKPVWMLQYNKEAHNLVQRRNCKDLSRRLQQFFDHYLKGEPMPAWMEYGVPVDRKGEYFGF
ncbi:MAG: prolyl oligopeptidase family serine peptidase [Candidatus Cryptobacteroides sp.]